MASMERSWKGTNVDLALLATRIGDFFKDKDFEAIKGKTPTGYQILAEDSPYFKLLGYASVTIEGDPKDFVVRLDLCGRERKHSLLPHFRILTMFGGGYFLLKELKSDEAWMKLRKEFGEYIEKVVSHLTNSAIHP